MSKNSKTNQGLRARAVAVAAAVLLIGSTAAACGAGGGSKDSAKDLRVLVEAGGHAELKPVAAAFEKETGTKVTLVELPYDGLYDRLSSELSSGSVSFDVAALDAIWLKGFADGVEPLDDMFTDDVKSDLFPSLLTEARSTDTSSGCRCGRTPRSSTTARTCSRTRRTRRRSRRSTATRSSPPTTWQQFADAAAVLHPATAMTLRHRRQGRGRDRVARDRAPGRREGHGPRPRTARPISTRRALEALDFYTELNTKLKVSPPGAAQIDWASAQNLFNQGQTAMTRFWAHAYPQIPDDSPVKGKIGVAVIRRARRDRRRFPVRGTSRCRRPTQEVSCREVHRVRLRAQRPGDRHRPRAGGTQVRSGEVPGQARPREPRGADRSARRAGHRAAAGQPEVAEDRRHGADPDAPEGRRRRRQRGAAAEGAGPDRGHRQVTRAGVAVRRRRPRRARSGSAGDRPSPVEVTAQRPPLRRADDGAGGDLPRRVRGLAAGAARHRQLLRDLADRRRPARLRRASATTATRCTRPRSERGPADRRPTPASW